MPELGRHFVPRGGSEHYRQEKAAGERGSFGATTIIVIIVIIVNIVFIVILCCFFIIGTVGPLGLGGLRDLGLQGVVLLFLQGDGVKVQGFSLVI